MPPHSLLSLCSSFSSTHPPSLHTRPTRRRSNFILYSKEDKDDRELVYNCRSQRLPLPPFPLLLLLTSTLLSLPTHAPRGFAATLFCTPRRTRTTGSWSTTAGPSDATTRRMPRTRTSSATKSSRPARKDCACVPVLYTRMPACVYAMRLPLSLSLSPSASPYAVLASALFLSTTPPHPHARPPLPPSLPPSPTA